MTNPTPSEHVALSIGLARNRERRVYPPMIMTPEYPAAEQEYCRLIDQKIHELGDFTRRLADALDLFDFCAQQLSTLSALRNRLPAQDDASRPLRDASDDAGNIFVRWLGIAGREGAMTIYHFGEVMEAVHDMLGHTPTLLQRLDRTHLKAANKLLDGHFKHRVEMRHAVAHAGGLTKNPAKRKENSFDGAFSAPGVSVADDCTGTIIRGIFGRRIVETINGKPLTYDLDEGSLKALEQALAHVYAAFDAARAVTQAELFERLTAARNTA